MKIMKQTYGSVSTALFGRVGQTLLMSSVWLLAILVAGCHRNEPTNVVPLNLAAWGGSSRSVAPTDYTRAYLPAADPTPGSFIVGESSFLPYNLLYPTPINKDYTTIGCFLVEADKPGPVNSISGYFQYVDENMWSTTVGVQPVSYFLFGYMPSNQSGMSASVKKRTGAGTTNSWADGCVMTISNLSTVTPADVCVVVGVKKAPDGFDREHPWSINDETHVVPQLQQGQYAYEGTESDNYVYLLLDHLYTNVNLELSVEPGYAELRTIVLKKVMMQSTDSKTLDAVITLTNDPNSPIGEVAFTPSVASGTVNAVLFPEEGQYASPVSSNPAKPTSVPGYFAPGQTTQQFTFEFVYDVYDKKNIDATHPYGNLVRENCHAVNKWALTGTTVTRGKSFKVTATIKPTYLYQLSEADLDNPMIEFEPTTTTSGDATLSLDGAGATMGNGGEW